MPPRKAFRTDVRIWMACPLNSQRLPEASRSTQVFVRYSGVIYNRWDYDPSTGKYLRFSDTADDYNGYRTNNMPN